MVVGSDVVGSNDGAIVEGSYVDSKVGTNEGSDVGRADG